ncbi:MAG: branched-chain amino acid ABC transporter permease [Bdellovibrionota bacterium]|jgi:branched-chain amino acid transport system permease protein
MTLFLQLLLNGLVNGCALALIALGFALIYNTTRIFHFAHGGIYALSGFLFYSFYTQRGLPIYVAVILTMLLAAVLGILIDLLVYRPLDRKGASTMMHMISSLGLYVVVVNIICLCYGNSSKVLISGSLPTVKIGGFIFNAIQLWTVGTFTIVFFASALFLRFSILGLKIRAARDNPTLLTLYGFHSNGIRLFVFGIGSALCALAAILIGLDLGINPHHGIASVVNCAVALIVGGIGVFEGAALGSLLLGALQGIAVWKWSANWQDMVTFTILIVFLLFRPNGILGRRGRLEEGVDA